MTDMIERSSAPGVPAPSASTAPTLTWRENRFLRNGRTVQVLSGSLHYFRVHPAQWRDRLQRLKDMGLNTVDTYVAWNFHQPDERSAADFTGWRDLEAFLRTAHEVGLDAIVRPGPYICAEWSNGALPVWLTARTRALRTDEPAYLEPVLAWFDDLIPRLARLQASQGGPIVAVQVENEFGSYGDDTAHLCTLSRALRDRGITEMLFTADGPTDLMLDAGAVDGLLTAITMGSRANDARNLARLRRPDEPFFAAEYWNGWFDHWGHPHHVRSAESAASTLADIVSNGGSVSIYMAHGGTNFGIWAGANRVNGELRGTITSYDSDAPVAEDGTLTDKFHAMRAVLGATDPVVSPQPRFLAPRALPVTASLPLPDALSAISGSPVPVRATSSFESLGQDGGLIRYSADVHLPAGPTELVLTRVADRAQVFVDGVAVGTVFERGAVPVEGLGRVARVELLVENLGRVNYGHTVGEEKGLLGPVLVERRMIQRWQAESMPLIDVRSAVLRAAAPGPASDPAPAGSAFVGFEVEEPLDAHLALPGFGHGFVWVNDFLLGRYWNVGPQETLYVPAPLLTAGPNTITVLELERLGERLEIHDRPSLGPEEEYIETF